LTVNDAVDLIQGEPGQKITLTVLHEGGKDRQPVDVEMTRAEIHVQSVLGDVRKPNNDWEYLHDKQSKIAYIRLTAFNETTAAELKDAVLQAQKEGARGLVLDLRNNPGGLLLAAREVSDLFLTEGRIVSSKGRSGDEEVYDARDDGTLLQPAKDFPMAVLVNKFSASASEIVAAALQDHGRAVVIGERTYGKGSVQNVIRMEAGTSALKLTTASYWRPSGKNIHRFPDAKDTDEWGVKPNDAGYKLTAASLAALKSKSVPEEVLTKLGKLPDKRFATEKEYLDAVGKVLTPEELEKHKANVLAVADRGFEVPMKDEERLEYMIYRRDRDVIHGKPGAPAPAAKPKDEKEKAKKPFVDRVLEKSLDYLRGELKKADETKRLTNAGVG
jgi:carboxyl-terminal processing protease